MVTNIVDINSSTSVVTLNMNGIYTPIKKQLSKYIKKKTQDPTICCHTKPTTNIKTQVTSKKIGKDISH